MGCNPQEGDLREIDDQFDIDRAKTQGYTEIFHIGEIIKIKACYFEVNNFVEDLNMMNLKLLKNEDALERISALLPNAETI